MISKNRLRGWFYNWVAYIISQFPRKVSTYYDLVIVRVDALGDFVIWHDCLAAYHEKYPGKKVLLVCADLIRPLAERESFFTDIISFNGRKMGKSLIYRIKTIWYVKSIESATVHYPTWQRHPFGDAIVASIKSSKKIGMHSHVKRLSTKIFDRCYNELIFYDASISELRAIEYFTQKAVLSYYKYGYYKYETDKLNIELLSCDYVVIAFSSSNDSKSWEIEKFSQIINNIPLKYQVVLTGAGTEDMKKSEHLISSAMDKSRIVNLVNKTSVADLVLVVAHSKVVIGNDSAAVHIAAATRVKSICVLVGAHFGRFLPYPEDLPFKDYLPITVYCEMPCYGCNYNCIHDDQLPYECIKKISAGAVIKEMMKILS